VVETLHVRDLAQVLCGTASNRFATTSPGNSLVHGLLVQTSFHQTHAAR
jgi:hypothetical protein